MHTSNSGKPKFTINQKYNVVQKVVAHEAKCPGMSLSLRLSSMSLNQYPTGMVQNWLAQKDDLATAVKVGCGSKNTLSVDVKRKMQSLGGTNDAEAKKKAKGMNDYNLDNLLECLHSIGIDNDNDVGDLNVNGSNDNDTESLSNHSNYAPLFIKKLLASNNAQLIERSLKHLGEMSKDLLSSCAQILFCTL